MAAIGCIWLPFSKRAASGFPPRPLLYACLQVDGSGCQLFPVSQQFGFA